MITKEHLQALANEAKSLVDILKTLNKRQSKANIEELTTLLDKYGIDHHALPIKLIRDKIPLKDILVENSSYQSTKLKKRLVDEGIKKDCCEICGQGNTWNNKLLVLQLDHINGIHTDNRLENLRIVCPNCHTQTDTFCTRKLKQHNYCKDCGKEIAPKSTWCPECALKHNRTHKVSPSDKPSKGELLQLIKEKPFTEIGRMYGVTDNAIRKWCRKLGLPSTKRELNALQQKNTDTE